MKTFIREVARFRKIFMYSTLLGNYESIEGATKSVSHRGGLGTSIHYMDGPFILFTRWECRT